MEKTIQELNDDFRCRICGSMLANGQLVVTSGVRSQGEDFLARAILAVQSFDDFDEDNDPYTEHDYGSFNLDDQKLMWKIDYYDRYLRFGSDDPSDTWLTRRVLTILLLSEY